MKIGRRSFLCLLPAAPLLAFNGESHAVSEHLPWSLLHYPHRVHLTAAHFWGRYNQPTDVWLNGQRIRHVTELIGSPIPGKVIHGALRHNLLNGKGEPYRKGHGAATSGWVYGNICWRPRKSRPSSSASWTSSSSSSRFGSRQG